MANPPDHDHPVKAVGWAARDSSGRLSPYNFFRRSTGEKDVTLRVLYCGLCHYDLHQTKNEWGEAEYPMIPGHEIVGEVMEVGSSVTRFKAGDKVGVGCMVGSCGSCGNCARDLENYCKKMIRPFNSKDRDGTITYGGLSDIMVADEHFAVAIPDNLPLPGVAPLLCIGITAYSPLRYYGLDKPGLHLAVVGLGGLGHIAVKFAKAMGLRVTVISTSPGKKEDALGHLGADSFLLSRDPEQLQAAAGTMDGIINTAVGIRDIVPLISLLKTDGKLIIIAAPDRPIELPLTPLLLERKMVGGSLIGGMKETQEMIDFASKHSIASDVEVVPMDYVNIASERLVRGDVRYRFVVDVGNTIKSTR